MAAGASPTTSRWPGPTPTYAPCAWPTGPTRSTSCRLPGASWRPTCPQPEKHGPTEITRPKRAGGLTSASREAQAVEHGRDRGRQVQTGDACTHRQAQARIGTPQELLAEPIALGSEGKQGARGNPLGSQILAVGVQSEQRRVEVVGQAAKAAHGQREVETRRAPHSHRVPGILAA